MNVDALPAIAIWGSMGLLAGFVWWHGRRATKRLRDVRKVGELAVRGDLDGALALLAARPAAERADILVRAALDLAERACPQAPADDDDDDVPWAAEADEPLDPDEETEAEPAGPPLDPALSRAALALLARALDAAPLEGAVLLGAANVLAALRRFEDLDALLARAVARRGLSTDHLHDLAGLAAEVDAYGAAHALAERALRARPSDARLLVIWGSALVAMGRAAEAVEALAAGLETLRRSAGSVEWLNRHVELEQLERTLSDLHDDAVRRTSSAEKVIDGHAAAGMLDARAGVNYRLMAHSLLLESDRRGRRLLVPSQDVLLRDGQAALAQHPDATIGHEDLGLHALRAGELERAEAAFRTALQVAPGCWPALAGLGATLDLRARDGVPPPAGAPAAELARLVEPWEALTPAERGLVDRALAPARRLLPRLVAAGARLHVVALDAKLTDLEPFRPAQGIQVEDDDDRRTHDAIDGMAVGLVAAIKIEALHERDEDGWVLAHELGHVLHALVDEETADEVDALYEAALREPWRSTEYGLRNPYEFFATGYERFALRHAFPGAPRGEAHAADVDLGVDAFFRRLLGP